MTRAFFGIFGFFSENVGKNCEKGPKLRKKVKIYVIKYNLPSLFQNIVDQIFKIFTIVETLVTVGAAASAVPAAAFGSSISSCCP